jgi:hypothetical protein
MKKLLPILAILSIMACSKKVSNPFHNEVTWRFVLYDSNSRVVDSTPELHYPDSATVPMIGPNVVSIIPPLAPSDTEVWSQAAKFFMVIGPSTLLPGIANIQVPSDGCAFNILFTFPTLDRSGWMLQRTENGKRINMFAQIQGNGYDGKYNDFPYPEYLNGVAYPWVGELDLFNNNWLCGSTQGSCQMAPAFLSPY